MATNVESYQATVVEMYDHMDYADQKIVDEIRDMTKKELNSLSSRKFKELRDLANRF